MNQKTGQQLALDAEKIFSNESLLLVTLHEQELNRSVIKQLHSDIKNVHILHPIFIPKRRCIIEIEKKSDINMLKSTLNKKQYDSGYITVDFIKNYKETNKNIDPCTLYVRNLPANVTNRDIEILYPTCMKYKFLSSLENSKSVLVHFHTAEDAVIAYKSTNNIFYQSNLLMIQFNRRGLKVNTLVASNETIEIDDEFDDELKEDDVDRESSDEDIDDDFINCDDFDYDDFGEGTHSRNTTSVSRHVGNISQENNNVTDTLHVQNLPSNITDDELLDLYPNCHEYRFLPLKTSRSKSALLRFHSIKDASVAHTDTSNTVYKSHTLYVQFYRKHNDVYPSSNDAEVINVDVSEDENECSIINDDVTEEINSGIRGENISQKKAKVNNKINVRPGRQVEVENVKKQADASEENVDPQVLHVENLPLIVTGEDLVKLYPACRDYQILQEKSQTTVSALIYFNTVHDAKEAYNATSNTLYKSRVLSIKFRCKTLNINPLAVMKRKTNHFHEKKEFSSKKLKSTCDNKRRSNSTDEEDVIVVGQAQKQGQMEEMKEDDVEYKSEEEEYTDDFGVDPEIDNDDYEEDAIEDDEDQDMELDENDTFLPHDEDDE